MVDGCEVLFITTDFWTDQDSGIFMDYRQLFLGGLSRQVYTCRFVATVGRYVMTQVPRSLPLQ